MNEINTETSPGTSPHGSPLQGTEVPPATGTDGANGSSTTVPPAPAVTPRVKVLERKNGMIAGVAGGIADYVDIDVTVVRLILVALALLTMPAIPLAYIVAWIIIPEEGTSAVTATPAA